MPIFRIAQLTWSPICSSAIPCSPTAPLPVLEHLDPFGVIKALCVVEDPRSGAQEALFLNAEG